MTDTSTSARPAGPGSSSSAESGPQMVPDPYASDPLHITITHNGAIFSGAANLRRFDSPTPAEIAAYIRSVYGDDPDGAHVHVVGEEPVVHLIDQALSDYGVYLTAELPEDAGTTPEETTVHEPAPPSPRHEDAAPTTHIPTVRPPSPLPVERPTLDADFNPGERPRGGWIIAAVVALVAVACAVALWWTVRGLFSPEPSLLDAHEPAHDVADTSPTLEAAPTKPAEPAEPEPEFIEQDGLQVQLPAGFTLEPDEDMWRAVGPDPNFRLQLSVDDRYNVPAQALAEQLRADIERDPEVELVETDGHSVTYLERAGDGSQALWKTWPAGAVQLSVGCHTRFEPTPVQRATCDMAMNSATFNPGNGQVEGEKGVVALDG